MPFDSDTEFGAYKIEALIGRGGMGEVYRARDTRLGRDVAIKVLPESFLGSDERIARFEREARLLATLSHHNIAGIYGLEKTNGTPFLVLELVEGDTLKEHLAKGALPVEESLRVCRQVAEALAAAHERGVIHRDLKPANIKITPDDTVKVLDFGIAKAFDPDGAATDVAGAATISATHHHTAAGTIVGTPSYMSPEQARGKFLDKRTDIWSFGCLLYECLTGTTAFGGESPTDAIARILEREPDFSALPTHTPPTVQLLLRRCLQKDRKNRLHDIGDARVEIDDALADPTGSTLGWSVSSLQMPKTRSKVGPAWWLCAALALVAAAASWTAWTARRSIRPALPTHLAFVTTRGEVNWNRPVFDLSPDGRTMVFVARPPVEDHEPKAPEQLYVHDLGATESAPIAGTERASSPAFSPSGNAIAFIAMDQSSPPRLFLKRVGFDGTPPVTLCDVTDVNLRNVTWRSEDSLVLHGWGSAEQEMATVSANGGTPRRVAFDDSQLGEHITFRISAMLPESNTALGVVYRQVGTQVRSDAILMSFEDGSCRTLLEDADSPTYAPGGHLLFRRDRSLLATRFDAAAGALSGRVVALRSGVGAYDFSQDGMLVYHPIAASLGGRQLATVDMQGRVAPLSPVRRAFVRGLTVSADGRLLAVQAGDDNAFPRIWVYEIESGMIRPVSPADAPCFAPELSPDGRRVAYTRWKPTELSIVVADVDGSQEPRVLLSKARGAGWTMPNCWAADGSALLIADWDGPGGDRDILRVPIEGGAPQSVLSSSAAEGGARLSPDGTLLAYFSDESGERHAYVRRYDAAGLGPRQRITPDVGGSHLFWSLDGRRLHYIDKHDHLMAVEVGSGEEPTLSAPQSVLDIDDLRAAHNALVHLGDDGGFVFIQKGVAEKDAEHLKVVLNWFEELNTRVSTP